MYQVILYNTLFLAQVPNLEFLAWFFVCLSDPGARD